MALAAVARLLDGVRAPVLRVAIAHSAALRRATRSRAYRLELLALAAVAIALLGAMIAPVTLFVWSPLVLGVPHLVADVRYLALGAYGDLPRRTRDLAILAPLAATLWWATPAIGGLAVLLALALSPRLAHPRTLGLLLVAGGLYAWAAAAPITASYVLVHGHNVVAIVLAALLVQERASRLLLGAAALGTAAILGGALDPFVRGLPLDDVSGYILPEAAFAAWPPIACARVALAFVFLQGLHYAAWLRLVPDALRPRAGMRTFTSSLRALETDLTRAGVLVGVGLALAVIAAGAHDALSARLAYLRLAGFHAYLELAFLARWLAVRPR